MARGRRTRAQLLDAAIELFVSRGVEGTSMRDIAARAGVGAPAVYNHFPSKDAVLAEALVTRLRRFVAEVLDGDDPSEDPAVRLEGIVRRHVACQARWAPVSSSVDHLLQGVRAGEVLTEPEQRATVERCRLIYRERIGGLVEDLAPRLPPGLPPTPVLVAAILGMCDRAPGWNHDVADGGPDPADACWRLVAGMTGLVR